ncbi:MAG: hypothetical protein H5T49_04390 [Hadesarchaea archaeon]|nr:hypothetical protein [Hadesarchaea archaeon]
MKGIQIAAAVVVIAVAIFGAAFYLTQNNVPTETTTPSQTTTESQTTTTTEPISDDFTMIEEMLNDLENFSLNNLESDFGIGAIAGSWD